MNVKNLTGLDKTKYGYCVKCKKVLPLSHFEVTSVNKNKTKFYKETCKRCEKNKQIKPIKPERIKINEKRVQLEVDMGLEKSRIFGCKAGIICKKT